MTGNQQKMAGPDLTAAVATYRATRDSGRGKPTDPGNAWRLSVAADRLAVAAEAYIRHVTQPRPQDYGIIQVVLPQGIQRAFRNWLTDRRLRLFSIPVQDDLPTYGITADAAPGHTPQTRPWRTQVHVLRITRVPGHETVFAELPGWDGDEVIRLPFEMIPPDIRRDLYPGARLHARVNIGAEAARDLTFEDWEMDRVDRVAGRVIQFLDVTNPSPAGIIERHTQAVALLEQVRSALTPGEPPRPCHRAQADPPPPERGTAG